MSLYNRLHHLVFRLKDLRDRSGIYSRLAQLKKEQYLPPQRLAALQNERLRSLLTQARSHSRYYRQRFAADNIEIDAHFDISRLPHLPLLRREDLQDNLEDILCDNARSPWLNSSGGSTGHPVNFYHDETYRVNGEAGQLLFLNWMGVCPGDRTAVFWGADREFKDLSRYDRWMMRINRVKQLNSFAMSDPLIEQFLEEINRYRPRYVYGYASSLYLVARFINRTAPIAFQPVAVRSSAEMLFDFQRREIERAFKAPVFDFYGSREVNNIAAECSAHRGLHVFASSRIVEVVDDDGGPVPDGELGQVAVTDLVNHAFPFIRYLTGDMAVASSAICACGRGYPLLQKIEGRSSDMIVIDGQYIHGEFFTHLFYGRPEITRFQLIQEKEDHLRLRVVSRDDRPQMEEVLAAIRTKVGRQVTISIEVVESIPTAPSGKHRFTISKLKES